MSDTERNRFEMWAVVEILGHKQYAGRCTEEPVAGVNMLRVDIPEVSGWPAHTKYFGGGSIYAIHPCSQEHATAAATSLAEQWGHQPLPVSLPDMQQASETLRQLRAVQDTTERRVLAKAFGESDDDLGFG